MCKGYREEYFEKNIKPYLSFKRQFLKFDPCVIVTGLEGSGRMALMLMLRESLKKVFTVKEIDFFNGDYGLFISSRELKEKIDLSKVGGVKRV